MERLNNGRDIISTTKSLFISLFDHHDYLNKPCKRIKDVGLSSTCTYITGKLVLYALETQKVYTDRA